MNKNFKRVMKLVFVLFGISMIAFLLGIISPGDPAELALSRGGNYAPNPEQIEKMREEMGLNQLYIFQFLNWLKKTITGDLGVSFSTNERVLEMILKRISVTISLSVSAFFCALIFGISLGIIAAYNRGNFFDYVVSSLSNLSLSLPGFWIALILILVFSEHLGWLPTSGFGSFEQMIMPTFVTALPTIAMVQRLMRAAMLKEYALPYYTAGIARGIPRLYMSINQVMRNALISIIPMLGTYLGAILGGSAIVESIFAMPGLGSLAIEAIKLKDFPVIQAYVLITGTTFVLVTGLVDIIIETIYPKIGKEK